MEMAERLKAGVKWMWSLGDYTEVAERLAPYAERLVDAAGIGAGMAVLDVAAGNGNVAIAAARRGATVTATDLTPQMIALGRARSEAAGLAIAWQEADAEDLPFAADQFDVVTSAFGAMFALRPARVAAELFRVAKPGGIVAMANYGDSGFLPRFAALIAAHGPQSPVPLPSPFLWGDTNEIHRRLRDVASDIAVEHGTLAFTYPSVEAAITFWERTNGPLIALRHLVPAETYAAVIAEATVLIAELNRALDGQVLLESAYVQIIARKKSGCTNAA
jgi:SAM-dependent methyltransferase